MENENNINETEKKETVQELSITVPEKKKEKPELLGIYVMLSILLLAVTASIILSAVTLNTFMTKSAEVAAVSAEIDDEEHDESTTKENDVTIGGEYVIRSTENISDAYKSGDTSSLNDKDKETLDMAEKVLKEIIKDDMSEYEKEKAVYEWMVDNLGFDTGMLPVIPTTQADCDNPYGVLKYKNAVCVGYATTFRLFMQMMDIPCMVVHDTSEGHSWDLVQLDKNWYHTDIYSDQGNVKYVNFNMNDEMCEMSHDWDRTFFPAAESLKYNVIYNNAKEEKDIYNIPKLIKEALTKDEKYIALKLSSTISDTDATIAYQMVDYLNYSMQMTEKYMNYKLICNFAKLDEGYLFIVSISKISDESVNMTNLTEEQKKKLTESFNEAFGADGITFNLDDFINPYAQDYSDIADAATYPYENSVNESMRDESNDLVNP